MLLVLTENGATEIERVNMPTLPQAPDVVLQGHFTYVRISSEGDPSDPENLVVLYRRTAALDLDSLEDGEASPA